MLSSVPVIDATKQNGLPEAEHLVSQVCPVLARDGTHVPQRTGHCVRITAATDGVNAVFASHCSAPTPAHSETSKLEVQIGVVAFVEWFVVCRCSWRRCCPSASRAISIVMEQQVVGQSLETGTSSVGSTSLQVIPS